jgi:hypothetical protein
MESNGHKHWTENWRALTPILVTVAVFMLGSLQSTVWKIDDKMFKHFTNEEIHIPRSTVVTKAEFDLMTKMRDKQVEDLKEVVKDGITQLRIEVRNPQVYKRAD